VADLLAEPTRDRHHLEQRLPRGDEARSQRTSRPEDAGLDRGDVDGPVGGHPPVGPAQDLALREHLPVARREQAQRRRERGGAVGVRTAALWGLGGQELLDPRGRGERHPRAPPQDVRADVAGDHVEPGSHAPLAPQARQRPPRPRQRLLRRVLRLRGVAQPQEAQPPDPLCMLAVERVERIRRGRASRRPAVRCSRGPWTSRQQFVPFHVRPTERAGRPADAPSRRRCYL